MRGTQRIGLALAVVFLLSLPVAAEPSTEKGSGSARESAVNILITIRLGAADGAEGRLSREYQLITQDGERVELMNGSRVPIPVTTFQATSPPGETFPITSYTYQNVGFTAQVRAFLQADGKIRIDAQVEDSQLPAKRTNGSRPTIRASQQQIKAVLSPGQPLRIIRSRQSKPTYLEFEARILN